MKKKKTIKAYCDGKFICDVIRAAIDNNKTVAEVKEMLVAENPGCSVTFKVV